MGVLRKYEKHNGKNEWEGSEELSYEKGGAIGGFS